MKISARDQARIGQLLLDGGVHQGRQIISREWVHRMQEPYAVGTVLRLAYVAQS